MSISSHGLLCLPDDLLLLVMTFSRVDDILSLRYTSKRLHDLSRLRWLWSDTLKRHVINKGLPIPAAAKDLRTFTSRDLETRAVHAARFHENWTSGHPRVKQSLTFSVLPFFKNDDPRHGAVTDVKFLPSHDGELILTVIDYKIIMCWEVPLGLKAGHFQVASWEQTSRDGLISDVVINQDVNSLARFAALNLLGGNQLNNIDRAEILVFSLDKFRGQLNILSTHRNDALAPLHGLNGDFVLCGDLVTFDWHEPKKVYRFRYPLQLAENAILAAKSVYGYMITVRQKSIHAIPDPFMHLDDPDRACELVGAAIELHYEVSEAVIVTRGLCNRFDKTGLAFIEEPITILLRCSDFATIRQYDFIPKHKTQIQEPRVERLAKEAIDSGVSPAFPFQCPSMCTRVIPIPPSCSQLHFTPSGKGVWLETRNIPTGIPNSTRPARCLVGVDVSNEPNTTSKRNDTVAKKQQWGNFLNVCEKEVYSRTCRIMEVTTKEYRIKSVAMEDCVGRIVIGDGSGDVEVLEYA